MQIMTYFYLTGPTFKKEFKKILTTPKIYLVCAAVSLLAGLLFYSIIVSVQERSFSDSTLALIRPFIGNLNFIYLMLLPLLTQDSFAQEKREGTLNLLNMSPYSLFGVVAGKWLAYALSFFFMLSLSFLLPLVLTPLHQVDVHYLWTLWGGLYLQGLFFISVGLWASTMFEAPLLASFLTWALLLLFFLLSRLNLMMENYMVGQMVVQLSPFYHFNSFLNGLLSAKSFYYFAVSFLFFVWQAKVSLQFQRSVSDG